MTRRGAENSICFGKDWFSIRATKKAGSQDPAVNSIENFLVVLRRGLGHHVDALAVLVELHLAVHQGEQSPVATRADILAGGKLGAALADEMLPAVTNSPPYRLTPSRLLALSRPLRTLP